MDSALKDSEKVVVITTNDVARVIRYYGCRLPHENPMLANSGVAI
jgi:hypothetical protein